MLSNTTSSCPARIFEVPVIAHAEVAPGHFRLSLACPDIARAARAGHFVHLLPREPQNSDPLLRRAFSVLSTQHDRFDVLYRVMGRGTRSMSRWRVGDSVSVVGPLGRPFPALAEYALLVGGGVGVPPLAMLASQREGHKVAAFIGARSGSDVLCQADFAQHSVPVAVATDDGSAGHHGFVTDLLQDRLKSLADEIKPEADSRSVAVYSCGPLPMLRRVAQISAQFGVECYVSLEEIMPCGIGVCNGCVVPVAQQPIASNAQHSEESDEYSSYRRTCVEGPVFEATHVDWARINPSCP